MPFSGGAGTLASPYLISNAADFDLIRSYLGSGVYFKLTNDIDLLGNLFNMMGVFSGNLDGAGFKVKNIKFNITSSQTQSGIFTGLNGATVKNIEFTFLTTTTYSSATYDGMLAGYAISSNIDTVTITITGAQSDKQYFGGLIGDVRTGSTIKNIIVTGDINGINGYVGGLFGTITGYGNTIDTVSYTGKLVVTGPYVGGFCAFCSMTGSGNDTHKNITCNVTIETTSTYCGGAYGRIVNSLNLTVDTVLITGSIKNFGYAGGFIGGLANGHSYLTFRNITVRMTKIECTNGNYAGGICGYVLASIGVKFYNVKVLDNILINAYGNYNGGIFGWWNNSGNTNIDNVIDGAEFNGRIVINNASCSYSGGFAGKIGNSENVTPETSSTGNYIKNVNITVNVINSGYACDYVGGFTGHHCRDYLAITDVIINCTMSVYGKYCSGFIGKQYAAGQSQKNITITFNCSIYTPSSTTDIASYIGGAHGHLYDSSSNFYMENVLIKGAITNYSIYGNAARYISGGIAYIATGCINLKDFKNEINITIASSSQDYVGGVVGYAYIQTLKLENVSNKGNINTPSCNFVSGIVARVDCAQSYASYLRNVVNYGNITGASYIAGVIGIGGIEHSESEFSKVGSTGNINGGTYVAGIVGNLVYYPNIFKEISVSGTISGNTNVGAIFGATAHYTSTLKHYDMEDVFVEATLTRTTGTATSFGVVSGSVVNETYGSLRNFKRVCINYTATIGSSILSDMISPMTYMVRDRVYINTNASYNKNVGLSGVTYLSNTDMKDSTKLPGLDFTALGAWGTSYGNGYCKLKFVSLTMSFVFTNSTFPNMIFKITELYNTVSKVEFILNGVIKSTLTTGISGGAQINYTIAFADLVSGTNIFKIAATDSAGYRVEETIYINKEAENKFSLSIVSAVFPNITFRADKVDAVLTSLIVYLNGTQVQSYTVGTSVNTNITYTVNESTLPVGDNTLKITAISGGITLNKNFNIRKEGATVFNNKKVVIKNKMYTIASSTVNTNDVSIVLDRNLEEAVTASDIAEIMQESFIPSGALSNSATVPTLTAMAHLKTTYADSKAKDEYEVSGEGSYFHSKIDAARDYTIFNSTLSKLAAIFAYKDDL